MKKDAETFGISDILCRAVFNKFWRNPPKWTKGEFLRRKSLFEINQGAFKRKTLSRCSSFEPAAKL